MNYFDLFELPVGPVVDKKLIPQKFFALQKANHPDFYSQSAEAEKDEALARSAAINKAYAIFQDDQKTIEYFLKATGQLTEEEKYALPNDFLMEMMDINEALAEQDATHVIQQVEKYEAKLWNEIRPVLENYTPGNSSDAMMLELKEYYYKKKYLKRILDRTGD